MLRIARVLIALMLLHAAVAIATTKKPLLGDRITQAVFFQDSLWVVAGDGSGSSDAGALASIDLTGETSRIHFETGVVLIAKSGDSLLVLRNADSKQQLFVVSIYSQQAFRDLPQLHLHNKDYPVLLLSVAGAPALLSSRALHVYSDSQHNWRTLSLSENLRGGVQSSFAIVKGAAYVGEDSGEWGGGLRRIDLGSGTVSNIERRDSRELCAGPLNSECDPVTGVVADSAHEGCVLASIGLAHLGHQDGRIIRVCSNEVTVVAENFIDDRFARFPSSEAIYGLGAASDGSFWTVTMQKVRHYKSDGSLEREFPLPKLERQFGVMMTREIPGILVLSTDANWAVSTSGYTPMIVVPE